MNIYQIGECMNLLKGLIEDLENLKGTERSVQARYLAIAITDLEKAYSVINTFVDYEEEI